MKQLFIWILIYFTGANASANEKPNFTSHPVKSVGEGMMYSYQIFDIMVKDSNEVIDTSYEEAFAPTGAEWYYDERFAFSGDINFIKFTSEKDTLINGENCQKISKQGKLICNDRPDVEFLYTSNDTVYFFDPIFNEFQVLYVFSARPGDSWIIKIKDEGGEIDSLTITIDSISTRELNERDGKALHVSYYKNDEYRTMEYSSTIVEHIGDTKYMFNWYPWSTVACDGNYTLGLRCYRDSVTGLYSTGIADSCDYKYKWTGIDESEISSSSILFPNPANDYINITIEEKSAYTAELYDLNGKLLMVSESFKSNIKLDLTDIESGIYILIIKENQMIIMFNRVVKS